MIEALEPRALLSAAVPDGAPAFTHFYYYPEGFAGSTISEFLPLTSPNPFSAPQYRVIAHYESDRPDQVLAEGTLTSGTRGGITISRAADHSHDLVDQGQPYALEVQSTGPLVASLSHYDFGSAAGETFTDAPANSWAIPQVGTGQGRSDFVLWYNTADTQANISVRFVAEDGSTITTVTTTTRATARGGLDLSLVEGLPASGTFAAVVTSDQPIVAAASRYFSLGDQHSASTELATSGSGATSGVMPLGSLAGNATEEIALFDPSEPPALLGVPTDLTATLTFRSADESIAPIQRTIVLTPSGVTRFDVGALATELGSSRYAVEFASTVALVGRVVHHEHNDDVASSFSRTSGTRATFADGFMDPARAGRDVFETIGVSRLPGTAALGAVRITAVFEGVIRISQTVALNDNGVAALDLHAWPELLHGVGSMQRYFYGVEVDSVVPVSVTMWHYDLTLGTGTPAGGFSSGPQQQAPSPDVPAPINDDITTFDFSTRFALGHDASPTPIDSVLHVPAGGPGQILVTLQAGVFNFNSRGRMLPFDTPATNQGIADVAGSLSLVGDGATLSFPGSPRLAPLNWGPVGDGVRDPSGRLIRSIEAYGGLPLVPWPDAARRPDPPTVGVDTFANVYRFYVDLSDTTTPRDLTLAFTGRAAAGLLWFDITSTPPPGDGTDGSVWFGQFISSIRNLAPLSLTIHIGD